MSNSLALCMEHGDWHHSTHPALAWGRILEVIPQQLRTQNAVEALTEYSPQIDPFRINLQVDRGRNGIHLSLSSPTALEQGLDPWQPGSSTKLGHLGLGLPLVKICCQKME